MEMWTDVKCYMCSRVCGESPGRGEHLERLRAMGRMLPGPFCTLIHGALRCSRCGGPVYPGESYSEYASAPPEETRSRSQTGTRVPSLAIRVA